MAGKTLGFLLSGAILILGAFFQSTVPAIAQQTSPSTECGCRQCHEQQYYLYDSGRWYCFCEYPMTCVHCHGGNGESKTAEEAHRGMRRHPFENNAAACQQCHASETQARVNQFIEKAGSIHLPTTPTVSPLFPPANVQAIPSLEKHVLGIWEWATLMVATLVLVRLIFALYK